METAFVSNENKLIIGFKGSPSLKATLCGQAEKLGITLSAHLETIVLTQVNRENELINLSERVKLLKEKIDFYEHPFLKELLELNKGKTIQIKNRIGEKMNLTINDISDVFTLMINSFETQK